MVEISGRRKKKNAAVSIFSRAACVCYAFYSYFCFAGSLHEFIHVNWAAVFKNKTPKKCTFLCENPHFTVFKQKV